jgi:chorismate mutase
MDLTDIRKKIDGIDAEIAGLLNSRIELALRAKKLKNSITDDLREEEVIKNVCHYAKHLLGPEFFEKVFKNIITESKLIQKRDLKLVGFQGEHGAFGDIAIRMLDSSLVPIPCREFSDVFADVYNKKLDLGIVPISNSLGGAVREVQDLLDKTSLKIVNEIDLPIEHCLLICHDVDFSDIKEVYSHPQALAQCSDFIEANHFEACPYYNTAGAAQMIAKKHSYAAAISSELCATLYNLKIIKKGIANNDSNITRFVVVM